MTTSEQNKFKGRFLLIDCRAMNNKNWPSNEVKYWTKQYLKLWQKTQRGMIYMISLVTYVQLKENRKGRQKEILEAVKQGNINTLTVIKSHKNHYAIIDESGEILECCYHIKPELLEILEETTADLPHTEVNTGK